MQKYNTCNMTVRVYKLQYRKADRDDGGQTI